VYIRLSQQLSLILACINSSQSAETDLDESFECRDSVQESLADSDSV